MRRVLILFAVLVAAAITAFIFLDDGALVSSEDHELNSGALHDEDPGLAKPEVDSVEDLSLERESIEVEDLSPFSPEFEKDLDDPMEAEEIGEPPLDPVQVGDCAVGIEFVDAETGKPVSGWVDFWRMDAPGNSDWNSGDQLQIHAEVKNGYLEVVKIPTGEYRAYALFARAGSATPEAFTVEGRMTHVLQRVEMPLKEHVHLHLYKSDGLLYSGSAKTVEIRNLGARSLSDWSLTPSWIKRRNLKSDSIMILEETGTPDFGEDFRVWHKLSSGPDGFPLWEVEEANRQNYAAHRLEIRVNQSASNRLEILPSGGGAYVGIFVAPAEVQANLVFPSDVGTLDLKDLLIVSMTAIAVGGTTGRTVASAWSDLKVRIRLQAPEIQPVDFVWRPASGPLPQIWLKASGE